MLLDATNAVRDAYAVRVPGQAFVDTAGMLVATHVGSMTIDEIWARARSLWPGTTYAISAKVLCGGGDVTPAEETVSGGDPAAITLQPDTGSLIAGITLDGVAQPVKDACGEVFAIPAVFADHSLVVVFARESVRFSDIAGSPFERAIRNLAASGVVDGYRDGTFRPDSPVAREQWAKMIVRGLDLSGRDPESYLAICVDLGISRGTASSDFRPYETLSREQVLSMFARAAGLAEPPADYTPDFPPGQFSCAEHYENARKVAYAGLLAGLASRSASLEFEGPGTRGEGAQLLWELRVR